LLAILVWLVAMTKRRRLSEIMESEPVPETVQPA
jgi:hypothetical protein